MCTCDEVRDRRLLHEDGKRLVDPRALRVDALSRHLAIGQRLHASILLLLHAFLEERQRPLRLLTREKVDI